jgi:DNA mismatch endonuclease (patch repair protein)
MDKLTKERRSWNMSRIRSKNTQPEILMRKALWHEGIRYRKNYDKLPGKPDIAITKYKIAVFCDGEFWHGKNWNVKKDAIKSNRDYWIPKIERNMCRDNENDRKLEGMGWVVLHFWGQEIKKKLAECVSEIKETIIKIESGIYNDDYYQDELADVDLIAAEEEPAYGNGGRASERDGNETARKRHY